MCRSTAWNMGQRGKQLLPWSFMFPSRNLTCFLSNCCKIDCRKSVPSKPTQVEFRSLPYSIILSEWQVVLWSCGICKSKRIPKALSWFLQLLLLKFCKQREKESTEVIISRKEIPIRTNLKNEACSIVGHHLSLLSLLKISTRLFLLIFLLLISQWIIAYSLYVQWSLVLIRYLVKKSDSVLISILTIYYQYLYKSALHFFFYLWTEAS